MSGAVVVAGAAQALTLVRAAHLTAGRVAARNRMRAGRVIVGVAGGAALRSVVTDGRRTQASRAVGDGALHASAARVAHRLGSAARASVRALDAGPGPADERAAHVGGPGGAWPRAVR